MMFQNNLEIPYFLFFAFRSRSYFFMLLGLLFFTAPMSTSDFLGLEFCNKLNIRILSIFLCSSSLIFYYSSLCTHAKNVIDNMSILIVMDGGICLCIMLSVIENEYRIWRSYYLLAIIGLFLICWLYFSGLYRAELKKLGSPEDII